jgi:hypothetical protein
MSREIQGTGISEVIDEPVTVIMILVKFRVMLDLFDQEEEV